jgi:cytochrome c oxidase subunit 4
MMERRTFLVVDVALMALLAATYGISYMHLGVFNAILNIGIALLMAGLVAWFFMHLRAATGLVRLFAGSALLWLLIMFGLGLSDWIAR